ncbi:DUF7546 family protein [Haloarchaeobius sp. DFWS5]|uniref:DUF7546 family protein n=1 Tax=Haloarchaeobius sp. DFWS5 TaxID=3446114 RepID=UPI003EBF30B5
MASNAATQTGDGLPSERVLWFALLCSLELFVVVAYFQLTSATVTSIRYVLYPFVWINLGVAAVATTRPFSAPRRQRLVAIAVAVGYFLLLAWLVGMVRVHPGGSAHGPVGLSLSLPSPGWGPTLTYASEHGHLALVPFRVVGYLALAYLVYATVLDSLAATATGLVALFSCVSCAVPLLSSLATSTGGSAAMLTTVYTYGMDVSTAVFVVALALLYYRPGVRARETE